MLKLFSLLGADTATSTITAIGNSAFNRFKDIIGVVLPIVAGILMLCAVILGIKIGISYAQAEDDEAKKKAKSQLINLIIGFLLAIVITLILWAVGSSNMIAPLFQ